MIGIMERVALGGVGENGLKNIRSTGGLAPTLQKLIKGRRGGGVRLCA